MQWLWKVVTNGRDAKFCVSTNVQKKLIYNKNNIIMDASELLEIEVRIGTVLKSIFDPGNTGKYL